MASETPKDWPPSHRVPIEEQSKIIAKVDALIERQKAVLDKTKRLRVMLLLGWRYWRDHQKLHGLLRAESSYQLSMRAHWAWKAIKEWREKNVKEEN